MSKLTDSMIRSLVADGKEHWIKDDSSPNIPSGLYIRQHPSGECSYYIRIYGENRKRIQYKIAKCSEMTIAQARARARQIIPKLKTNGVEFLKPPKEKATPTGEKLFQAWQDWSKEHTGLPSANRPKLVEFWRSMTQFHKEKIGEMTKKEIDDKISLFFVTTAERTSPMKAASINRYVTEIKFLVRWGIEQGLIEDSKSHWEEIKKLPETDSAIKKDHFTDEERDAIRAAASNKKKRNYYSHSMAYIAPMIEVLLRTGLRPSSVLGLLWSDFDCTMKTLLLRPENIKTKNYTVLPISDKLVDILSDWRKTTVYNQDKDFIFSNRGKKMVFFYKQIMNLFEAARKIMGHDFHFHPTPYSFRHDYASEILAAGGTISDVQHLLIHADPRMSNKYAHPQDERMRHLTNLLNDKKRQ